MPLWFNYLVPPQSMITRMQHLDDKRRIGDWTPADEKALRDLNNRDYSRLKAEFDAGLELTPEETKRLDGHEAQIAAFNAREAEAAKKPEPAPGTLPAVASAKAPEGVDSMGALGDILRKEKVKEALTQMFTPEQLAPLAEQSKQEYWDKYIDPRKVAAARMEELATENPAVAALCAEDIHAHHQVDNSIHEAKGALIGVGVVTFGVAMWTAPIATAVETGIGYFRPSPQKCKFFKT